MAIFWKTSVGRTSALLDLSGKRELFWYGVTIGQIGFGVLASQKRQPTTRAVDVGERCPKCKQIGNHLRGCPVGIANRPRN